VGARLFGRMGCAGGVLWPGLKAGVLVTMEIGRDLLYRIFTLHILTLQCSAYKRRLPTVIQTVRSVCIAFRNIICGHDVLVVLVGRYAELARSTSVLRCSSEVLGSMAHNTSREGSDVR
jgi:hypothetical protein